MSSTSFLRRHMSKYDVPVFFSNLYEKYRANSEERIMVIKGLKDDLLINKPTLKMC